MGYKYVVCKLQPVEVERTDSEGRITSLKTELIPLATKTELKALLKESPELIFLKPIPNISGETPYQGFLMNAPQDQRFIVEGRKSTPPPSNPLEMMMQSKYGREIRTFAATIQWSERSKKWIVIN